MSAATVEPDGRLRIQNLALMWNDRRYSTPSSIGCTFHHLRDLPPGLRVEGQLHISLPSVRNLSVGLHVGLLTLNECSSLKSLPQGLRVSEDAVITNCGRLKHVPADSVFEKDFGVYNCPKLIELPKHEQVAGGICLGHPVRANSQPLLHEGQRQSYEEQTGDGVDVTVLRREAPRFNTGFLTLPVRAVAADVMATQVCSITLEPLKDIKQVIFWQRQNTIVGADFREFMNWWREHQNDPETRQSLPFSAFFRREEGP